MVFMRNIRRYISFCVDRKVKRPRFIFTDSIVVSNFNICKSPIHCRGTVILKYNYQIKS